MLERRCLSVNDRSKTKRRAFAHRLADCTTVRNVNYIHIHKYIYMSELKVLLLHIRDVFHSENKLCHVWEKNVYMPIYVAQNGNKSTFSATIKTLKSFFTISTRNFETLGEKIIIIKLEKKLFFINFFYNLFS